MKTGLLCEKDNCGSFDIEKRNHCKKYFDIDNCSKFIKVKPPNKKISFKSYKNICNPSKFTTCKKLSKKHKGYDGAPRCTQGKCPKWGNMEDV